MARLVLLCGTSFSGKSTLARALAPRLAAEVVSLDELNERRGLWGGDGIPVEEWVRTHELASAEVRGLPSAGTSVVVDDTSSPRFLRDRWRSLAREAGARFTLVYVDVDQATVRRRWAANRADPRRRDVADAVFEQHLADFEPPQPDEAAVVVRSGVESRVVDELLGVVVERPGLDER
ncbi:ATP-binding protein [Kribbella sp. HUAS MG21]|uniref:ATP-binding protein n=1 Tax=Kribbella sp. HUAS MG21 TaxID=3160966 RepID=A0AAU7TCS5_9ACTN